VTEHQGQNRWLTMLNRVWRVFTTAIAFSLFGLGGLVLGIFVFPLIFLFIKSPGTRQNVARRIISNAFKLFLFIVRGVGAISYEITGIENADTASNQIIIANHPTLIDVIFLVSVFPQADCVIKESITRNLFMRSVVFSTNYIASGTTSVFLRTCVSRLKSGASLLLFPEGTRTVPGQALDFKLGAASLAVKAGSTILPVTIQSSHPRYLAKNQAWYRIPPEKPLISLHIYPSQPVESFAHIDHDRRKSTRELNQALLNFFNDKLS